MIVNAILKNKKYFYGNQKVFKNYDYKMQSYNFLFLIFYF